MASQQSSASAPAAPDGTARALGRWLIAGNLLVLALLALIVGESLQSSRRVQLERAESQAINIARALAQGIQRDFARVDLALQAVVAVWARGSAAKQSLEDALGTEVADLKRLLPEIDTLLVADADGRVRFGRGVDGAPAVNNADRDFFQLARDADAATLVVSEPWVGRVSNKWVLSVARPLRTADGRFSGVVYANIAADHFIQQFRAVEMGDQGAISLRTTAMTLVGRFPPGGTAASGNGTRTVSAELTAALKARPERGSYITRSAYDGVDRASAYQRVENLPLLVLTGLGTHHQLASWRADAARTLVVSLLFVLALAGASWVLHRAWKREVRSRHDLRREADRNRALLTTASDGIHVLDRAGRLIECNDAFARMLGQPREALVGRSIWEWDNLYPRERFERWLSSFKVGVTRRTITRYAGDGGGPIDVEVSSTAIALDGQELIYCSARDITESLRLQGEVERSERFVREVTDNVPLRIAYIDAERRYRFVNQRHCERLGLARTAILGRTRAELGVTPLPPFQRGLVEAAWAGQPQRFEFEEELAQGKRVIESRLVPDVAADGSVRGLYTVGADVTERHTQQRRLERALEERETLLREVYHRVKNNLQVIQSLLGLQRRATVDPGAQRALEESARRVRAMALVHEKLYQTRSLESIDLAAYAHDLLRDIDTGLGARRRGIRIDEQIDPIEAPLDLAVPFGLLINELVTNCLKHGYPEGRGGTVTVRLDACAGDAAGPRLRVADDGVGLPAGFALGAVRSLGLELATGLAAQLGGVLAIAQPGAQGGAAFEARLHKFAPRPGEREQASQWMQPIAVAEVR